MSQKYPLIINYQKLVYPVAEISYTKCFYCAFNQFDNSTKPLDIQVNSLTLYGYVLDILQIFMCKYGFSANLYSIQKDSKEVK